MYSTEYQVDHVYFYLPSIEDVDYDGTKISYFILICLMLFDKFSKLGVELHHFYLSIKQFPMKY